MGDIGIAWQADGMLMGFGADEPHMHSEKLLKNGHGKNAVRGALSHHASFEADDAGSVMRHHAQIVAYHDLGEALRSPKIFQKFAEKAAAFKVYSGRGFIQHQKFRLLLKSKSQQHALHLTAGKRADTAFHEMGGMHHFQKFPGLCTGVAGSAQPQRPFLYAHAQEFCYREGHGAIDTELLRDVSYADASASEEFDMSSVAGFSKQCHQKRGFPRSIGPDDHRTAAAGNSGAYFIKDIQTTGGDTYVIEHDGGGVIDGQGDAPVRADWHA